MKSYRELVRILSITISPIFALFFETLSGIITIRAFNAEPRLRDHNFKLLDANLRPFLLRFTCNCWLGLRLDLIGVVMVLLTSLFVVMSKNSEVFGDRESFVPLAGLALSLSMSIPGILNAFVYLGCEVENQMVSVERISSYSTMPQVSQSFCFPLHIRSECMQMERSKPVFIRTNLDVFCMFDLFELMFYNRRLRVPQEVQIRLRNGRSQVHSTLLCA
jgi:ABC-type multidrug transport system fused ATPase/permease subunit